MIGTGKHSTLFLLHPSLESFALSVMGLRRDPVSTVHELRRGLKRELTQQSRREAILLTSPIRLVPFPTLVIVAPNSPPMILCLPREVPSPASYGRIFKTQTTKVSVKKATATKIE